VLAKIVWFSTHCFVEAEEAMILYDALHWVKDFHLDNIDFALDFNVDSSKKKLLAIIVQATVTLMNLVVL